MIEYPKIQSIFKRDENKNLLEGQWTCPEFDYLSGNIWVATEKVDGTNIRVTYFPKGLVKDVEDPPLPSYVLFQGRTSKAQIPAHLVNHLNSVFTRERFSEMFPDLDVPITLYGEGYGEKIQSGGKYMPDGHGVGFVLFDVLVGHWWLQRQGIVDVAMKMGIPFVPILCEVNLAYAIGMIKYEDKIMSSFGKQDFPIEGFVLKPKVDLCTRNGQRVITKIKYKDFKR